MINEQQYFTMNLLIRGLSDSAVALSMQGWHRVFRFTYTLVQERNSKIRRKPAKEGYVELNIEQSYYKLTLKASEHIPLRYNRASKLPVSFSLSSSSSPAVTLERRGLLERFPDETTRKFQSCIFFIELVVKAIIFNIKVFVAHTLRVLRIRHVLMTSPIWKWPLGQRAEVRDCLVKRKIGIRLTKRGTPWNSC